MQTSGPICSIEDFQASMTDVTCSPSEDISFKLTATNTCGDAAFADFEVKIYPEVNHVAEVEHIHDYEVDSPNNCNALDFEATHTICADITDQEGDSLIFSWSVNGNELPYSSKCFEYIQDVEVAQFSYTATDLYDEPIVGDSFAVTLKEESSDPVISYFVTSVDGSNYEENSNIFSIAHDDDPNTNSLDLGLIDAFGEMKLTLKERFGEDVKIKEFAPKKKLFGFGNLFSGVLDILIYKIEERISFKRFGL